MEVISSEEIYTNGDSQSFEVQTKLCLYSEKFQRHMSSVANHKCVHVSLRTCCCLDLLGSLYFYLTSNELRYQ